MKRQLASIRELLEGADDAELLEAIAVAVSHLQSKRDAGLLKEHLYVLSVWEAAGRVSNGGIKFLLESDDLEFDQVVESFNAIGASEALEYLKSVERIFPNGTIPRDPRWRVEFLDRNISRVEGTDRSLYSFRILPLLADYVRSRREHFRDLPRFDADVPISAPIRTETPDSHATSSEVARWVLGLGGTVEFHEHKNEDGSRIQFYEVEDLPQGPINIAGVVLPNGRRDTRESLKVLSQWVGSPRIEKLSLDKCSVPDTALKVLSEFSMLKDLDLGDTRVGDAGLGAIAGIKGLRRLNLARTCVTDSGLGKIAGLPFLSAINIAGSEIRGMGLGLLTGIEELALGLSRFDDKEMSFLKSMLRIRSVRVNGVPLGPGAISNLRERDSLESLVLWETGLEERDLEPLRGHKKIAFLSLAGLTVSIWGAKLILTLPHLGTLHVDGRRIDPEAKSALLQARPSMVLQ